MSYERGAEATVGDVMTRGVVSCEPDTSLREVAELMVTRGIHCVVVFAEDTQRWGVVSDLDLIGSIEKLATATAGGAAATPVVMAIPSEPLRRAAGLMTEHRTAHLIVVDPMTIQPIGVLSTLDLARAALAAAPSAPSAG